MMNLVNRYANMYVTFCCNKEIHTVRCRREVNTMVKRVEYTNMINKRTHE